MHLEDILAQCLSLPGVSLTHDDHHATLRLVTEGGHGTIDFHVLWPGFTLALSASQRRAGLRRSFQKQALATSAAG